MLSIRGLNRDPSDPGGEIRGAGCSSGSGSLGAARPESSPCPALLVLSFTDLRYLFPLFPLPLIGFLRGVAFLVVRLRPAVRPVLATLVLATRHRRGRRVRERRAARGHRALCGAAATQRRAPDARLVRDPESSRWRPAFDAAAEPPTGRSGSRAQPAVHHPHRHRIIGMA